MEPLGLISTLLAANSTQRHRSHQFLGASLDLRGARPLRGTKQFLGGSRVLHDAVRPDVSTSYAAPIVLWRPVGQSCGGFRRTPLLRLRPSLRVTPSLGGSTSKVTSWGFFHPFGGPTITSRLDGPIGPGFPPIASAASSSSRASTRTRAPLRSGAEEHGHTSQASPCSGVAGRSCLRGADHIRARDADRSR